MSTNLRENIDELINHLWQNGYFTVSRKYGTFLPEPAPIGIYNVHAVAKYNKKYALGIVLTSDDLNDARIKSKLEFLATRQTKYSKNNVNLFVGVSPEDYSRTKSLVESLSAEAINNIKIVVIHNKQAASLFSGRRERSRQISIFLKAS